MHIQHNFLQKLQTGFVNLCHSVKDAGQKRKMSRIFITFLFLSALAHLIHGFAYEYTFEVEAGDMQCFYQQIDVQNVVLEVEFQVTV